MNRGLLTPPALFCLNYMHVEIRQTLPPGQIKGDVPQLMMISQSVLSRFEGKKLTIGLLLIETYPHRIEFNFQESPLFQGLCGVQHD